MTNRDHLLRAFEALSAALPSKKPAPLMKFVKMLQEEYPAVKFEVSFFDTTMDKKWSINAPGNLHGIVEVQEWPAKNEHPQFFDVFMMTGGGGYSRSRTPVLRDASAFPTFAFLKKAWQKLQKDKYQASVLGPRPDQLPDDPKITKVTVRPFTVDEWVGINIDVEGDWKFDKPDFHFDAAQKAFARKVFDKALPEAKRQAAKFAGHTARVWENGSGPGPMVKRQFPMPTAFDQVDQIDHLQGGGLSFSFSHREDGEYDGDDGDGDDGWGDDHDDDY